MSGPCRRWRPAPVANEERARERVVTGLAARFPRAERSTIEERVDAAWERLGPAVVRDFIPILVAKEVGEEFDQERGCTS